MPDQFPWLIGSKRVRLFCFYRRLCVGTDGGRGPIVIEVPVLRGPKARYWPMPTEIGCIPFFFFFFLENHPLAGGIVHTTPSIKPRTIDDSGRHGRRRTKRRGSQQKKKIKTTIGAWWLVAKMSTYGALPIAGCH